MKGGSVESPPSGRSVLLSTEPLFMVVVPLAMDAALVVVVLVVVLVVVVVADKRQ